MACGVIPLETQYRRGPQSLVELSAWHKIENGNRIVESHPVGFEDRVSPDEEGHVAFFGDVSRDIAEGHEVATSPDHEIHFGRELRHFTAHDLHGSLLVIQVQIQELSDAHGHHKPVRPRVQAPFDSGSRPGPPFEGARQHRISGEIPGTGAREGAPLPSILELEPRGSRGL